MALTFKQFVGIPCGGVIAWFAYSLVYPSRMNLFIFLCVIAFLVCVIPFVLAFLVSRSRQAEKEAKFLEFARDLVEGVKTGTPVNKAIVNLQRRDYGALSVHVRKLANQVSLGLGLEQAFVTFAKETNSVVISRAVGLITEAQRAGGEVETIIQSVAGSVGQIQDLQKERSSSVYNLIVQGYIIFCVFIVIMLVLEYAILPLAVEFSQSRQGDLGLGEAPSASELTNEAFSTPLFVMLLVQSLFAGLVIGKVSEGSVLGGIKHSFLLTAITLLAVTGTRSLLG